jgi:hypothetical protein
MPWLLVSLRCLISAPPRSMDASWPRAYHAAHRRSGIRRPLVSHESYWSPPCDLSMDRFLFRAMQAACWRSRTIDVSIIRTASDRLGNDSLPRQPAFGERLSTPGAWPRPAIVIARHSLRQFCLERGIVTPAARDHVEPHRGDVNKFWLGPFQSLCKRCHDLAKKFVESRGYRSDIGFNG